MVRARERQFDRVVWAEFNRLQNELELYFQDVTDHLITRAMGSDGDDSTLCRPGAVAGPFTAAGASRRPARPPPARATGETVRRWQPARGRLPGPPRPGVPVRASPEAAAGGLPFPAFVRPGARAGAPRRRPQRAGGPAGRRREAAANAPGRQAAPSCRSSDLHRPTGRRRPTPAPFRDPSGRRLHSASATKR